jgi:hypothetical protein
MANSAAVMDDQRVLRGPNEDKMIGLQQSIDMLSHWRREKHLNISAYEAAKVYSKRIFGILTTNYYHSTQTMTLYTSV